MTQGSKWARCVFSCSGPRLGLASDQLQDSKVVPLPWYFETFLGRSKAEIRGTLRPNGAWTPSRLAKDAINLMTRAIYRQSTEFQLHPKLGVTPMLFVCRGDGGKEG